MRESLCELSVHLNRNTDKSLGILFLVVFGLSFPPLVTFSWFSGWFIQECYTPKWTVIAPTIAFNGLSLLFGNIPLLVFFALALECFAGLSSEITQVNALLEQRKLTYALLSGSLRIIKTMEKSRSLLSFNFFWMLTNSSIEILVLLYLVPAHFINYSKSHESITLLNAAFTILYAIYYCSLMIIINIRAQRVTDRLRRLKSDLQDIYQVPDKDFMVTYEYQTVTASFMKDRIVDKMNDFSGFDGRGYFVLGKSFLLSFLSFCATYFVILLQFKLSE